MPDSSSNSSQTQDASSVAMRIASMGPRTASTPVATAAPDAANMETPPVVVTPSADVGQPETSTQAAPQSTETTTEVTQETPTDTHVATGTQSQNATPAATKQVPPVSNREEEDRKVAELLGLSEVEPTNPEEMRKKYRESSKEAHALRDKINRIQRMLETRNVQLVQTSEGHIELQARDGYDPKVDNEDIEALISDEFVDSVLSADDKKSLLKQLVTKAQTKMLTKYPKVSQKVVSVLPNEVQNKTYAELVQARLSDGTERYPGIQTPEYRRLMAKIYQDPANRSYAQWMHQSPDNYRAGIDLIYHKAYRVLGNNQKSAVQPSQPQGQAKIAGVQVSVAGSGGPAIQQMSNFKASDAAKSAAERIAKAKIL